MEGEGEENYNSCVHLQLAFHMHPGTSFINVNLYYEQEKF